MGIEQDLEGSISVITIDIGRRAQELYKRWDTALMHAVLGFLEAQRPAASRIVKNG